MVEKILHLLALALGYFNLGTEFDNGAFGKCFEIIVKVIIGNYQCKGVARQGRLDTRKKGFTFEIKTNCGELGNIDRQGNIKLVNTDYIIYSGFANFKECLNLSDLISEILMTTFVIPTEDFLQGLTELGLIRTKRSSKSDYIDKVTIQSYKNSKKKSEAFETWLQEFDDLATFFDIVETNKLDSIVTLMDIEKENSFEDVNEFYSRRLDVLKEEFERLTK